MDTKLLIRVIARRRAWLFRRLDVHKALNLASATVDFALKREKIRALPPIVKIDISPLCNLRCTACVHADPNGNAALEKQTFGRGQRMAVDQYRRIIEQIKGKTAAVSLYYLGDPMTHPDLDGMCRIAADAGLQVHVSTNFSFGFTDERIRSIVQSGLSHLTVCIDGLSQEKYERTRVGGNIARVVGNLERVASVRTELGQKSPLIEVQYIMFQHNLDEVEKARTLCGNLGVDQFSAFWGDLHNWTDHDPGNCAVTSPRAARALPRCYWPYFSTVIKWNGDVIPCCTYRHGSQYVPNADARVFGNVFARDLVAIWNSPEYRQARRLVSDPGRSGREPELKRHFCDSCPVLFETTHDHHVRKGDRVRFEEVYTLNEKGRPVRKGGTALRPARRAGRS